ncbi:conserved hypothetical protein [Frankia sp. Hr75.2]|nr:conserved hypothetical protein [Frankia sp. Hr75.2]
MQQISLAPPEEDLTADELIRRARELRPILLGEQLATEERGTYSPEQHERFDQAGFYRILQPRRFGGYELDVANFVRVIIEIARGCPSTGWCLCLAAGHHVQLAGAFSARTQTEVYGTTGFFAAPCRPIPMGVAVPVEAGWRISGEWDYCSGVPYSNYALVAVRLPEGSPAPVGLAVVPRDSFTELDDWRVNAFGMRGSGSNTITIDGATVPDHYVVPGALPQLSKGAESPGYLLHGNPMYSGLSDGYNQMEIAAVLVGAAWAAVDEFDRLLRTKSTGGPKPAPRYTAPDYQRWLAEAVAKVTVAEQALLSSATTYRQSCADAVAHGPAAAAHDTATRLLVVHQVADLVWEAVELLYKTSGSSEGGRTKTRMQRYYRDVSTAMTNIVPKFGTSVAGFAAAHFGLDTPNIV